jgi:acyl dehydratase
LGDAVLDYEMMKGWHFDVVRQTYSSRDTMLYALSIGVGADSADPRQLQFAYEKHLKVMPSMATVLGPPKAYWTDPRTGANYSQIVHGEERLKIFKAFEPELTIHAQEKIVSLTDLGASMGALAQVRRRLHDSSSNELLAECTSMLFLRGDGGFSELSGKSDPRPDPLPAVPSRQPDTQIDMPSLPQTALLYRLNGDYNPLHADPETARAAGFPRPILHGLCSFGIAAHAVLRSCCDYNPAMIRSIAVRFAAPVFPGDVLRFSIWRIRAGLFSFRAVAKDRERAVLDLGVAEIQE